MLPGSSPAPADIVAAVSAAMRHSGPRSLDVRWFSAVTSTMDVAEAAARANAAEGLVVVADEQTQGRGRRGRIWSSPPGAGLYLTFIFRPPLEGAAPSVLPLLTLATGVAVREALFKATGFQADLKWPNDVMVGRRKLAGILAEGLGIGTVGQSVLVGIGINVLVATHPDDVSPRATSIEAELGRAFDRGPLLEQLLVAVPVAYDALQCGRADDILRAWRQASPSAVGRTVEWQCVDGLHRGTTAGIDDTGALLVTTPTGPERVIAGELTWM